MPNLRDRLANDLKQTAYRENEVGEWHVIDGKRVKIVLDADLARERRDGSNLTLVGIDIGQVLYFAMHGTLAKVPKEGDRQVFDGRAGIIRTVSDDGAQYEITVSFNQGVAT